MLRVDVTLSIQALPGSRAKLTCMQALGLPLRKVDIYFKFVKPGGKDFASGKSVPPASKKVGRENFPSHLPRWDKIRGTSIPGYPSVTVGYPTHFQKGGMDIPPA